MIVSATLENGSKSAENVSATWGNGTKAAGDVSTTLFIPISPLGGGNDARNRFASGFRLGVAVAVEVEVFRGSGTIRLGSSSVLGSSWIISLTLGNGSLIISISLLSGSRNRSATDFRLGVGVAVVVRFGSSARFFGSLS